MPARFGRPFWLLWGSSIGSALGDGVRAAALPLLAATLTRDPVLIAAVTTASRLPWLLLSPLAGALTDRVDRRRLLWFFAALQAAVMGAFTLLVGAGLATIGVLVVAAFLLACAEIVSANAFGALVPDVAARERLTAANSWLQGGSLVASDFAGVALGAALFAVASALPFAVDAVTFALAAVLVARLGPVGHLPDRGPPSVRLIGRDIVAGVVWLARHRLLRALCLLIALTNVAEVGVLSIAVLYALEVLGVAPATYGLLMLVIAVGGLVGLVSTPALAGRLGLGRTLQLAFLLYPWPFLVAAYTTRAWVAAGAFFFVGVSVGLSNVASASVRQMVIPRHLYGRVGSSYRWVAVGLGPVGGVAAGFLADAYGLHAPFLAGGVVLGGALVLALATMSNRAVDAARRHAESATAAPVAGG